MSTEDVIVKSVPPVRIAELTAVAKSYESPDISPVIQPLYPELMRRLAAAGVTPTGPAIAYYVPAPDESAEAVTVHAGIQVAAAPHAGYDFAVVDLPGIERAATIVHHGSMDGVEASIQVAARWIEDNGYTTDGFAREVYLEYCADDVDNGVTELQLAVTPA